MTTFEPAPRTDFRAPAVQGGRCPICGGSFEKGLQITIDGVTHEFDCLSCLMRALASTCECCGSHVSEQGINVRGTLYCSLRCAESEA